MFSRHSLTLSLTPLLLSESLLALDGAGARSSQGNWNVRERRDLGQLVDALGLDDLRPLFLRLRILRLGPHETLRLCQRPQHSSSLLLGFLVILFPVQIKPRQANYGHLSFTDQKRTFPAREAAAASS